MLSYYACIEKRILKELKKTTKNTFKGREKILVC